MMICPYCFCMMVLLKDEGNEKTYICPACGYTHTVVWRVDEDESGGNKEGD